MSMKTSLSLISSQVNQDDYIQTIINELYEKNSQYRSIDVYLKHFYFLILLIFILDYLDEIRSMVVSHSEK